MLWNHISSNCIPVQCYTRSPKKIIVFHCVHLKWKRNQLETSRIQQIKQITFMDACNFDSENLGKIIKHGNKILMTSPIGNYKRPSVSVFVFFSLSFCLIFLFPIFLLVARVVNESMFRRVKFAGILFAFSLFVDGYEILAQIDWPFHWMLSEQIQNQEMKNNDNIKTLMNIVWGEWKTDSRRRWLKNVE